MEEAVEAIQQRIEILKASSIQLFKIANETEGAAPKQIVNDIITRTDNDIVFLQDLLILLHQTA